jgi:predicted dehydrogenase
MSAERGQGLRRGGAGGRRVRIAILGLGSRGAAVYANYVRRRRDAARLVAVADPVEHRREEVAARHRLAPAACFADYRDLTDRLPALGVDAAIVALPDADHVEAMVRLVPHGVPVLMEKPLASTEPSLRELTEVSRRASAPIFVAHVLRYTPFFRTIKAVLAGGALGPVRTLRLEENIGYWHFAHSYVRGNWRRADLASPMILAKSCHDLDALRWLAGAPPRGVSSFGSLTHFRPENAPPGAPGHCLDGCPAAESCPFYAPRYYMEALAAEQGPPVTLLGPDISAAGRRRALATGPFGRCVYRCDNDVADHQQVLVSFANEVTAVLTVSAFTSANTRTIQVTCANGEIMGRMDTGDLQVHLFAPPDSGSGDESGAGTHGLGALPPEARLRRRAMAGPLAHEVLHFRVRHRMPGAAAAKDHDDRSHAGGDEGLLDRFVDALAGWTPGRDLETALETSLEVSLDSHWMAFAAERSRRTGQTVRLPLAGARRGGNGR